MTIFLCILALLALDGPPVAVALKAPRLAVVGQVVLVLGLMGLAVWGMG